MAKFKQKSLDKALNATFNGPKKSKVKIGKHEFNFKKVEITREKGRIFVNGNKGHQISHHLRFRPDDQIFYEFEISRLGKVENIEIKISKGSDKLRGWVKKAKEILEFISAVKEMSDGGGNAKADGGDGDVGKLVRQVAAGKAEALLDGGWRSEALFVIANVMLMLIAEHTLSSRKASVHNFRPRRRLTASALAA